MTFDYAEYRPAAELATYIASYWSFDVTTDAPSLTHQVLPDGCISLACRMAADGVASLVALGPRLTPFLVPVHGGDRYFGIRFWPDAGGAALRTRAEGLRDAVVPAADLLGGIGDEIVSHITTAADASDRVRACDHALRPVIARATGLDAPVRAALTLLIVAGGDVPIRTLAERTGAGSRQLQRRFRRAVGLTMKEFARIRRVRVAAAAMLDAEPASAAQLAVLTGFSDQPHFIRELARVAGASPTALRERLEAIRHGELHY